MTTTISGARLLSIVQAAEIFGLGTKTIRRRIATGELPAYHNGRRLIRVKASDVDHLFRRVPTART
ncbi:MAG: helix-turn-helix domain-containing protein [Micropruina sp.]